MIMSITNNQQKTPSCISLLLRSSMGTDVVISVFKPCWCYRSLTLSLCTWHTELVYIYPWCNVYRHTHVVTVLCISLENHNQSDQKCSYVIISPPWKMPFQLNQNIPHISCPVSAHPPTSLVATWKVLKRQNSSGKPKLLEKLQALSNLGSVPKVFVWGPQKCIFHKMRSSVFMSSQGPYTLGS